MKAKADFLSKILVALCKIVRCYTENITV